MRTKTEDPNRQDQQGMAKSITIFVHTVHTRDSIPSQLVIPAGSNVGQAVIGIVRLLGEDFSTIKLNIARMQFPSAP